MNFLKYIVEEIHTTVIATVDNEGLPITCAIDLMDYDSNGIYFLTAKGKNFYNRLIDKKYIALTGLKGESTMDCVAVSLRGKVKEIGSEKLKYLFEKNPYMYEIYPSEESRRALTVFLIYEGSGEWFDLSKKPIERYSFNFGGKVENNIGYFINNSCIGCGKCQSVCPQNCIVKGKPYFVEQEHCLHCGNCLNVCPVGAVEKR